MLHHPATTVDDALSALDSAVSALGQVDLVGLGRDELLDLMRGFETVKRRLPVIDHALVVEADDRGLAGELCCASTAVLLRGALRLSRAEAARRVRDARALGRRRSLAGVVLGPKFAAVAAAQADGLISGEHAVVITRTVNQLPSVVRREHGEQVEALLTEHAEFYDPDELRVLARRLRDGLDPDGSLSDDEDHWRRRSLSLTPNGDGSYTIRGRLTPECALKWRPILDTLARPRPAGDTPDPRSGVQRTHDALNEVADLVDRNRLPQHGGVPTTLFLFADLRDLREHTGYATDSHGDPVSIDTTLNLLSRNGRTVTVVLDAEGGVHSYGRERRTPPPPMRLALIARDRGCTFPGCDRPPTQTEAHHVSEWDQDNGPTDLDNLALACGYHHRDFRRRGWRVVMTNGVPYWIAPRWIHPDQQPRRNTHFHPDQLRL